MVILAASKFGITTLLRVPDVNLEASIETVLELLEIVTFESAPDESIRTTPLVCTFDATFKLFTASVLLDVSERNAGLAMSVDRGAGKTGLVTMTRLVPLELVATKMLRSGDHATDLQLLAAAEAYGFH